MTSGLVTSGSGAPRPYGSSFARGREPANLGDILERVLDKGLVIAGDIRVNLLEIELLTIKLRLVIASLETARDVGIDWWESDPWLSAEASKERHSELQAENRRLRRLVNELRSGGDEGAGADTGDKGAGRGSGADTGGGKGAGRGSGADTGGGKGAGRGSGAGGDTGGGKGD